MPTTPLLEQLRATLVPQGTAPVVRLAFNGTMSGSAFYNHDFIKQCLDEVARLDVRAALGEPPTALEKLAIDLLLDSAYIERP